MAGRISEAQLIVALRANAGVMSYAASALGITRQSVCERVAKSPKLQAVCAEAKEQVNDIAEAAVVSAIRGRPAVAADPETGRAAQKAIPPDLKQANWWLDRIGKARGFTPQRELVGKGGAPLFGPDAMAAMIANMTEEQRAAFNLLVGSAGGGDSLGTGEPGPVSGDQTG